MKALKGLFQEVGEKPNFNRYSTYKDIQETAPDAVWDYVKDTYHTLIDEGNTSTQAKAIIARIFFGSD